MRPLPGYAVNMDKPAPVSRERSRIGLCLECRHSSRVTNDRDSVFYRCQLSDTDPGFAKYPRLPVLRCTGYSPASK